MASLPEEARRLRNESPRLRVPRFNLVMIALSLVVTSASIGFVLTHRRSPALETYGRLFSHRTWQWLEAASFLFFVATIAIARAKRRNRS
jgi:hypothetical protein